MGIKRRLFIYNTISVLLALAAMLAVSSITTHFIADNYQHQSLTPVSEEASHVQQLLQGDALRHHDWPALNEQLQAVGYNLQVSRQGAPVFSSLDPAQSRLYREACRDTQWGTAVPLIIQNPAGTMVGVEEDGYTVVSLSLPSTTFFLGSKRQPGEVAVLSMLISGAAAMVIIVLFSLFFTHRQVKKLLKPVDALAQAARRIEEGDFSQPVDYGGRNEFSAVCAAFNHMQEHLLAEQEKTAAYEQARTDLVAGISHDLRTPLTSVKGYIKGLRDGVAKTPEKQQTYLDIAYQKSCEMDVLLQRLFYFSKLETGNLPMFLRSGDLGDFVRHFAEEAAPELEQSGGTLEAHIFPAAHPVQLDQEQFFRVLNNLKDNALRYAQAESLCLTLTVWRQGDMECVRFADNGQGVSPDSLPHLFEQFWREDLARSSKNGEGSGLGLYIVKCIVEAHGGTIRTYNDQGLVFDIALPRQESEPT